jgi:hypothetical protein
MLHAQIATRALRLASTGGRAISAISMSVRYITSCIRTGLIYREEEHIMIHQRTSQMIQWVLR